MRSTKLLSLMEDYKFCLPLMFLFAGYVYETSLLHLFSINADGYFSINDYLSACFSKIISICIMFLGGVFFSFVGEKQMLEIFPYGGASQAERNSYAIKIIMVVIAFCFLSLGIYSMNVGFNWFMFPILACIMSISLLYNYVDYRIWRLTVGISLYFALISGLAVYEHKQIMGQKIPQVDITFIKSAQIPAGQYAIITSNSQYYFLYNVKSGVALTVPAQTISFITMNAPKS